MSRRRLILVVIGLAVIVFALLVLVGNMVSAHTNPPVTHNVQWNDPATEQLARRACFDCHSNETRWPWYSYIAPFNFLVVHDVDEGRAEMNLSTGRELEGDEMAEQIQRGEMPPAKYLILHPDANLSAAEKQQLIAGLRATFGGD